MFVVFNRKMYAVDFYFQLFRSPRAGEVVCDVARSVFFCVHESSISHSFSVYQVDIYAAHTSSIATRTPAHQRVISDGAGKKNLEARGKHWESERRVTIFFTQKIWPQIVNLCWFVVVFINRREHLFFDETHSTRETLLPSQLQPGWMLRGFSAFSGSSLLLFSKKTLKS